MKVDTASDLDRAVRYQVYDHFARLGKAPLSSGIAAALGRDVADIRASLERLEQARAFALTPGTREVWMAHPFSAVPTPYPVEIDGRTYWANCGWDALSIPLLLGRTGRVRTLCPDCNDRIDMTVTGEGVEPDEGVAHFVVPPRRFWDNVGFT